MKYLSRPCLNSGTSQTAKTILALLFLIVSESRTDSVSVRSLVPTLSLFKKMPSVPGENFVLTHDTPTFGQNDKPSTFPSPAASTGGSKSNSKATPSTAPAEAGTPSPASPEMPASTSTATKLTEPAKPAEPEFERDTEESEEMSASEVWKKVLMPKSAVAPMAFAAGYDQRLFDGWVKQPSPCCGAASIAGAYNALHGLHRSDGRTFRDLTDVLAKYCAALARGRRKRVERMLDGYLRCILPGGEEIKEMGEFFSEKIQDPMFFNSPEAVQAEWARRHVSHLVLHKVAAGGSPMVGAETSLDSDDCIAQAVRAAEAAATAAAEGALEMVDGSAEVEKKAEDAGTTSQAQQAQTTEKREPGKDMTDAEKKALPVSKYAKTEEKFPMSLFLEKHIEHYLFNVEQRTWTGAKKKGAKTSTAPALAPPQPDAADSDVLRESTSNDDAPKIDTPLASDADKGVTKTAAQNALKAVCEAHLVLVGAQHGGDKNDKKQGSDHSLDTSSSTEAVTASSGSSSAVTSRVGSKESAALSSSGTSSSSSKVSYYTPYSDLSSAAVSPADVAIAEDLQAALEEVGMKMKDAGPDAAPSEDLNNRTISSAAVAGMGSAGSGGEQEQACERRPQVDYEAILWQAAAELSTEERFRTEIGELYHKKRAVARLTQYLPGTAEIGNWGIIKGCKRSGLACSVLANRRTILGGKNPSAPGEAERKEALWRELKANIGQPNTVLLFHLTNHYALLYCWREFFHLAGDEAGVVGADEEVTGRVEPGAQEGVMLKTGDVGATTGISAGAAVVVEGAIETPHSEKEADVDHAAETSEERNRKAAPKRSATPPPKRTPRGSIKKKKTTQGASSTTPRPSSRSGGTLGNAPSSFCSSSPFKHVREIYTARKGQRPTAWLSLDEVYKILVGWSGYAIMKVTLKEKSENDGFGSDMSNDDEDEAEVCQ